MALHGAACIFTGFFCIKAVYSYNGEDSMKYGGKSKKQLRRFGFILLTTMIIPFMRVDRAEAEETVSAEEGRTVTDSGLSESGWINRNGRWFYSDPVTGMVKKGWLQLGDKRFYLSPQNGEMQTGWREIGEKWYYFNPVNGRMRTGWLEINDKWFYLSRETGEMQTGWLEIKGKWYYFNPANGRMRTGWLYDGGKWYFMDPASGAMRTGWVCAGGKYYYMNSRGAMVTGWLYDGGKWYYLESDGTTKNGWLEYKGKYYYFKKNGEMAAGEVVQADGKRQGFSGTGEWLGSKSDTFLDAYEKAGAIVREVTDDSMTMDQKLRACLAYMQNNKHLGQPWIPHYKEMDWVEKYANHMFDNTYGNCFCFAACFGLMARAIGYEDVYCCNSGIHGWCEIGGNVYDPQWTIYHVEKWNRPLMKGDSPKYLESISRTEGNWQYIRL